MQCQQWLNLCQYLTHCSLHLSLLYTALCAAVSNGLIFVSVLQSAHCISVTASHNALCSCQLWVHLCQCLTQCSLHFYHCIRQHYLQLSAMGSSMSVSYIVLTVSLSLHHTALCAAVSDGLVFVSVLHSAHCKVNNTHTPVSYTHLTLPTS